MILVTCDFFFSAKHTAMIFAGPCANTVWKKANGPREIVQRECAIFQTYIKYVDEEPA